MAKFSIVILVFERLTPALIHIFMGLNPGHKLLIKAIFNTVTGMKSGLKFAVFAPY